MGRNRHNDRDETLLLSLEPDVPFRVVHIERPGREPAAVIASTVELSGGSTFRYDYVVRVDVSDVAPTVRFPEVTVRAREGDSVSSRAVASEMGRAKTYAAAMATRRAGDDGSIRITLAAGGAVVRAAMKGPSVGGRAPVPEEDLARAVEAYRRAQERGRSTTQEVAAALEVSASTARKRVSQARRAGLLPPAESTRPTLPRPSGSQVGSQRRRKRVD